MSRRDFHKPSTEHFNSVLFCGENRMGSARFLEGDLFLVLGAAFQSIRIGTPSRSEGRITTEVVLPSLRSGFWIETRLHSNTAARRAGGNRQEEGSYFSFAAAGSMDALRIRSNFG